MIFLKNEGCSSAARKLNLVFGIRLSLILLDDGSLAEDKIS